MVCVLNTPTVLFLCAPVPARFLFSLRVPISLACNSLLSLHHNLQRLHLVIDHVHLHTMASIMHSLYTFGYLSWSYSTPVCSASDMRRSWKAIDKPCPYRSQQILLLTKQ